MTEGYCIERNIHEHWWQSIEAKSIPEHSWNYDRYRQRRRARARGRKTESHEKIIPNDSYRTKLITEGYCIDKKRKKYSWTLMPVNGS